MKRSGDSVLGLWTHHWQCRCYCHRVTSVVVRSRCWLLEPAADQSSCWTPLLSVHNYRNRTTLTLSRYTTTTTTTRLNAFTPSCLFNATAVQYRTSINQHRLILSHSPGGSTTLETPFSLVSFGKSFMKIHSAVSENGCLIFCGGRKKKTKKQEKQKKHL